MLIIYEYHLSSSMDQMRFGAMTIARLCAFILPISEFCSIFVKNFIRYLQQWLYMIRQVAAYLQFTELNKYWIRDVQIRGGGGGGGGHLASLP
jgi:hypothetical protein